MSSYVKATNFATKDTLPTGDSNKIVKGTEIDNELNAIAGAISSKSDIASPSFTGTPAAPTATSGSNTTQLANTAFVTAAVTDTVTSTTTFTNKTINLTSNTLVGTTAQFNAALSDNDFATIAGAETLTSKTLTSPTINTGTLVSPTMTGTPVAPTAAAATNTTQVATTAHVFAERTNTATLTNKTLNLTNNTLTGTIAQFNTALSDDNFATVDGTETLTNKTLTSPTINSPTVSSPTLTGTPVAPTASAGTNTTQVATTAFVVAERTNAATLTNKTLTSPTINSATISGGSISGITDLAVADGGTGVSSLTANAVVLGNGTSGLQTVSPSTSGNVLTSNGSTWVSSTPTAVKGLGLSGEIYNNVTSSRALNTTYTNSRTYPIMVIASNGVNNGPTGIQIVINGTTISNQTYDANGTYGRGTVTFIVPPSTTYAVTGSASVQYWYELY